MLNINETIKHIETLINIILEAQKIRLGEVKVEPMKIKQEAKDNAPIAVPAMKKATIAQELAIVKAEEASKIAAKKQ